MNGSQGCICNENELVLFLVTLVLFLVTSDWKFGKCIFRCAYIEVEYWNDIHIYDVKMTFWLEF